MFSRAGCLFACLTPRPTLPWPVRSPMTTRASGQPSARLRSWSNGPRYATGPSVVPAGSLISVCYPCLRQSTACRSLPCLGAPSPRLLCLSSDAVSSVCSLRCTTSSAARCNRAGRCRHRVGARNARVLGQGRFARHGCGPQSIAFVDRCCSRWPHKHSACRARHRLDPSPHTTALLANQR